MFTAHHEALLQRLALACSVPILLAYGTAGLLYGHLAMLTPGGFIDMAGASTWLAAVAAFSLALAATHWLWAGPARAVRRHPLTVLTTHTIWAARGQPLRQVQLRTTVPPEPADLTRWPSARIVLFGVAVVAVMAALAVAALQGLGLDALKRPQLALAPRSEWLLWPLPHVWRWLMPLARDHLVLALLLIGGALIGLSAFLESRKVQGAWMPVGVIVPLLFALSNLGSAAYDYAVARGLGALHDADVVAALASDPGRHNAYTFISLWTAIACVTVAPMLGGLLARTWDPASR